MDRRQERDANPQLWESTGDDGRNPLFPLGSIPAAAHASSPVTSEYANGRRPDGPSLLHPQAELQPLQQPEPWQTAAPTADPIRAQSDWQSQQPSARTQPYPAQSAPPSEWVQNGWQPQPAERYVGAPTLQPRQEPYSAWTVYPPQAGVQTPMPVFAWTQNYWQPPQAYQPQAMPPQAYQPQGMPPQAYQPQGMPPQTYQPQGMPPQAYQPQAVPPQPVFAWTQNYWQPTPAAPARTSAERPPLDAQTQRYQPARRRPVQPQGGQIQGSPMQNAQPQGGQMPSGQPQGGWQQPVSGQTQYYQPLQTVPGQTQRYQPPQAEPIRAHGREKQDFNPMSPYQTQRRPIVSAGVPNAWPPVQIQPANQSAVPYNWQPVPGQTLQYQPVFSKTAPTGAGDGRPFTPTRTKFEWQPVPGQTIAYQPVLEAGRAYPAPVSQPAPKPSAAAPAAEPAKRPTPPSLREIPQPYAAKTNADVVKPSVPFPMQTAALSRDASGMDRRALPTQPASAQAQGNQAAPYRPQAAQTPRSALSAPVSAPEVQRGAAAPLKGMPNLTPLYAAAPLANGQAFAQPSAPMFTPPTFQRVPSLNKLAEAPHVAVSAPPAFVPAPQMFQPAPQPDKPAPQMFQSAPQPDKPIPQMFQPAPQTLQSAPQPDKPMPQTLQSTPQIDISAPHTSTLPAEPESSSIPVEAASQGIALEDELAGQDGAAVRKRRTENRAVSDDQPDQSPEQTAEEAPLPPTQPVTRFDGATSARWAVKLAPFGENPVEVPAEHPARERRAQAYASPAAPLEADGRMSARSIVTKLIHVEPETTGMATDDSARITASRYQTPQISLPKTDGGEPENAAPDTMAASRLPKPEPPLVREIPAAKRRGIGVTNRRLRWVILAIVAAALVMALVQSGLWTNIMAAFAPHSITVDGSQSVTEEATASQKANAANAAVLLSASVTPAEATAPATLTFKLTTNTLTSSVRLKDDNGEILRTTLSSAPQDEGLIWQVSATIEAAYTGDVHIFLRDQAGVWAESDVTCSITVH